MGALVSPATAAKESEDGESQVAAIPVPDSDAVSVPLIGAFVVMVSVSPEKAPIEGGVTVTEIVQLEPTCSVPPRLGHVPDKA